MIESLVEKPKAIEAHVQHVVELPASSKEHLDEALVDWLSELLFLFSARGLVFCSFSVSVGEDFLRARLAGTGRDLPHAQASHCSLRPKPRNSSYDRNRGDSQFSVRPSRSPAITRTRSTRSQSSSLATHYPRDLPIVHRHPDDEGRAAGHQPIVLHPGLRRRPKQGPCHRSARFLRTEVSVTAVGDGGRRPVSPGAERVGPKGEAIDHGV